MDNKSNAEYAADALYCMRLDDTYGLSNWRVTRVPGGWIYDSKYSNSGKTVFVPFNNEFQKAEHIESVNSCCLNMKNGSSITITELTADDLL